MSVGHPRKPTRRVLKVTGNRTIKAAPIKEPVIEPNPPIIIMKSTSNDLSIEKASVGSAAPSHTEKYSAPATPI